MEVLLETGRLLLRALTPADVDDLVALDADPAVVRYLTGGRPTPRRTVEQEVLPRVLRRHPVTGRPGSWAAQHRGTGGFPGWFEFRHLDDGGTEVELGYRLRRAARGRGLATEGARALVDEGFAGPLLQRITASTMTVNTASRRVLGKAGLRHVRTVHQPWPEVIGGSEHGDVEYAITRAEWAARHGRPRCTGTTADRSTGSSAITHEHGRHTTVIANTIH